MPFLIAVASILVFGFVLGTFAYGNQLWAAPLKLGGGLLFAGLLLLGFAPALWIFAQGTASFGFMRFLALASWSLR